MLTNIYTYCSHRNRFLHDASDWWSFCKQSLVMDLEAFWRLIEHLSYKPIPFGKMPLNLEEKEMLRFQSQWIQYFKISVNYWCDSIIVCSSPFFWTELLKYLTYMWRMCSDTMMIWDWVIGSKQPINRLVIISADFLLILRHTHILALLPTCVKNLHACWWCKGQMKPREDFSLSGL